MRDDRGKLLDILEAIKVGDVLAFVLFFLKRFEPNNIVGTWIPQRTKRGGGCQVARQALMLRS